MSTHVAGKFLCLENLGIIKMSFSISLRALFDKDFIFSKGQGRIRLFYLYRYLARHDSSLSWFIDKQQGQPQ